MNNLPTEQLLLLPTGMHIGIDLPHNIIAEYTEHGYRLIRFELIDKSVVLVHLVLEETIKQRLT
jgi:hypothetical protein